RTTLDVAKQVAVRLDAKHVVLDEKAKKEIAKDPARYKAALAASVAALKAADWTAEALERTLRTLAEQQGVAAGNVFQPIRIALTYWRNICSDSVRRAACSRSARISSN